MLELLLPLLTELGTGVAAKIFSGSDYEKWIAMALAAVGAGSKGEVKLVELTEQVKRFKAEGRVPTDEEWAAMALRDDSAAQRIEDEAARRGV
jgi:hypothetical protein